MELLRSLKKEDILEVLSNGFCNHCEDLVHARIRSLHKRKLNENSSDDEIESIRDAVDMPVNGNASNSESVTRRLGEQWDSPRNSLKKHDSVLSMRNDKQNFDSPLKYLGDCKQSDSELLLNDGISGVSSLENGVSEEQRERIRYSQVHSKKDFACFERINGRDVNLLQGLELHTGVFSALEQNKIVEHIYRLQWRAKQEKLRDRTYSEPRRWMRGKGRVTIQFGCCYNYAVDKNGNPPGIVRDEEVDPLPPVFKQMIKRMVRSVFILNGNGADVAKHCIPSVTSKRISITFRKMDESKLPYKFSQDPELVGIKPLLISPLNKAATQHAEVGNLETQQQKAHSVQSESDTPQKTRKELFHVENEFPPLNGSFRKSKVNKFGSRARH